MYNEINQNELLDKCNSENFIYLKDVLGKFDNYTPKLIVILDLTEELNTFISIMAETLTRFFKSNRRDVSLKDFYNLFVVLIEVYNLSTKYRDASSYSKTIMPDSVYVEELIQEAAIRYEQYYNYIGSTDSDSTYDLIASNTTEIFELYETIDKQLEKHNTDFSKIVTFKWSSEMDIKSVHNVELILLDFEGEI